jgi:hypothetical protein
LFCSKIALSVDSTGSVFLWVLGLLESQAEVLRKDEHCENRGQ